MFPFVNLGVYKKAFEFNRVIYSMLKRKERLPSYIKTQLGRASLSIMLNIAEGSGKFSDKDRRNYFVVSRGSAFECAAIIDFLFMEKEVTESEKNGLDQSLEEISRMLFTMIKNLEKKPSK